MDDEIERMVIDIRADTSGFAREMEVLRQTMGGPLQRDADRAGRAIEAALARAVRTGKFGFDDLKRTALAVLGEIAAAAVSGGIASVLGGRRGGGGSVAATLVGAVAGLPGRATGGPVSPGAAYVVGERGPLSGQSAPSGTSFSGHRRMPRVGGYRAGRSAEPKAGGDQPDDFQAMRCVGGS